MILMDVAMPGIDGIEAMRRIKAAIPTQPIVIASAHSMASDRERFLAAGADDILSKPFRLADLVAIVGEARRQRKVKDLTGTRIGQYEIVERLGGGGMAVVYRAVQQPLGREVALKALSPELFQDDGFVKRFETEAKTLAKLDHPNILPIYDFEVTEGVAYPDHAADPRRHAAGTS